MSAGRISLAVTTPRGGFVEGPRGYFSLPEDAVENPVGSGLYDILPYLDEDPDYEGLYEVPVVERTDYFFGTGENVLGYSVQEDATSLDPGDMSGGAPQIQAQFVENIDTLHLNKEIVTLEDTYRNRGRVQGVVRNLAISDQVVSLTMDSVIALFNADYTVPPLNTTFAEAMQFYFDLVQTPYVVDVHPDLADRPVVYPGWRGNMLDLLKQIMAREQAEMAVVDDVVQVRPVRSVTAFIDNVITETVSIEDQSTARAVEVAYYNNTWGTRAEVYPLTTEEPSLYVVDAGETLTVEVPLNASLVSVNQPVCLEFVEDRTYEGTQGVYSVSGADGKPITPAQWNAFGGSVKVELTDDPSVIKITVKGMSLPDFAPYRIAMTAGPSNYYNSLHITGTGVVQDRQIVHLRTGATSAVTGEEVGLVVENPFISTRSEALTLGLYTVRSWAGSQGLEGASHDLHPVDPNTQGFGNIAGARVKRGKAFYRVRSATITPDRVDYSADQDTLVSDFNDVWTGLTVKDFNDQWAGKLVKDFNTEPLRRDDA